MRLPPGDEGSFGIEEDDEDDDEEDEEGVSEVRVGEVVYVAEEDSETLVSPFSDEDELDDESEIEIEDIARSPREGLAPKSKPAERGSSATIVFCSLSKDGLPPQYEWRRAFVSSDTM